MDKYEMICQLGEGGFGSVFKAKHKEDGIIFAIKTIKVDFKSTDSVNDALKEANLLKSLDCPFIVKFTDVFLASLNKQNSMCMVMTYYQRGDLLKYIRNAKAIGNTISETLIRKWLKNLMTALSFIHSRKIIHRDIKSNNLFLSDNNDLILGDFGISTTLSEGNKSYTKAGTKLYMSPEIIFGQGYDESTDIWSSGIVLYELMMLKCPFETEGYVNLYTLGKFKPKQIPDAYTKELIQIVYRMIEVKPNQRIKADEILNIKWKTEPKKHVSIAIPPDLPRLSSTHRRNSRQGGVCKYFIPIVGITIAIVTVLVVVIVIELK